jgi:drug/metabolite transporter (DMT)-like permease
MMGLGVLGIGVYGLLGSIGIAHSTAGNSALLVNVHPLMTALLAPYLIGEATSQRLRALVCLGFLGVVVIFTDGFVRFSLLEDAYFLGNLLLVLAAICLSLYTVYIKKFSQVFGGLIATSYAVLGGTLFLLTLMIASGTSSEMFQISVKEALLLTYTALVTTVFGWVVWFRTVAVLGAAKGTSLIFLTPVSGILCAWLILAEPISVSMLVGASLSIGAVAGIHMRRSDGK